MKKILALVITVLLASCVSNKKTNGVQIADSAPIPGAEALIPENAPQSVIRAVENAPQGVLIGIGFAKMQNMLMAQQAAETRAKADIARQINKVSTVIIRAYSVKNEIDPSDETVFRETLTVSLSKADITGVSKIQETVDDDGAYWAVVMMTKPDVITQIVNIIEEAKTAAPSMASFDASALINDQE